MTRLPLILASAAIALSSVSAHAQQGYSWQHYADLSVDPFQSPVTLVYGHNDLLPANFIDDGERIWLIDWDYAGFNSPLFDLGGLASNNGLSPMQEDWLLETYFDAPVSDALRDSYSAMKCASLLRETMWSMVSEIHSSIDFDYAAYTHENLARFEASWKDMETR